VGVETIGQLAELPLRYLESRFGTHGTSLGRRARGLDESPVSPTRAAKSISHEHTFAHDVSDREVLERHLLRMCDRLATRLRRKALAARTVTLKARFPDFETITRRATLDEATDVSDVFHREAVRLLHRACRRGIALRLIGVGLSGLRPVAHQLTLFSNQPGDQSKLRELNRALDAIREKHGSDAIRRASLLTRPRDRESG